MMTKYFKCTKHKGNTKFYLQIVNRYLDFNIENYLRQLSLGYKDPAGPEVLRMAHIGGPLGMLAVGVAMAMLAFLGELAAFRMHNRKLQTNQSKNVDEH